MKLFKVGIKQTNYSNAYIFADSVEGARDKISTMLDYGLDIQNGDNDFDTSLDDIESTTEVPENWDDYRSGDTKKKAEINEELLKEAKEENQHG